MNAFVETVRKSLRETLPIQFIPTKIIPISYIPLNKNGKIDESSLKKLIELEDVSTKRLTSASEVWSDKERILQICWSDLMKVDLNSIRKNDSFFSLGGDSIIA
jgi:hypothetical protein